MVNLSKTQKFVFLLLKETIYSVQESMWHFTLKANPPSIWKILLSGNLQYILSNPAKNLR